MEPEAYLTKQGEADLRNELKELIEVKRPELARRLKEAIAQGDLKENADYHDAKEQQGFIEGRIQHIEAILRDATIIEDNGPSDEVRIGSTVVIREEGIDGDDVYEIVGSAEANPRKGKISHESPIGKALLGKEKGQQVKVEIPDGTVIFKIIDVR